MDQNLPPLLDHFMWMFMTFMFQFGSAVKLPGSGGAVVGLCLDQERLVRLDSVSVGGDGFY